MHRGPVLVICMHKYDCDAGKLYRDAVHVIRTSRHGTGAHDRVVLDVDRVARGPIRRRRKHEVRKLHVCEA
jgi:hypothetical protein